MNNLLAARERKLGRDRGQPAEPGRLGSLPPCGRADSDPAIACTQAAHRLRGVKSDHVILAKTDLRHRAQRVLHRRQRSGGQLSGARAVLRPRAQWALRRRHCSRGQLSGVRPVPRPRGAPRVLRRRPRSRGQLSGAPFGRTRRSRGFDPQPLQRGPHPPDDALTPTRNGYLRNPHCLRRTARLQELLHLGEPVRIGSISIHVRERPVDAFLQRLELLDVLDVTASAVHRPKSFDHRIDGSWGGQARFAQGFDVDVRGDLGPLVHEAGPIEPSGQPPGYQGALDIEGTP